MELIDKTSFTILMMIRGLFFKVIMALGYNDL